MRTCATCGTSLDGRRDNARYCSDACRARARRETTGEPTNGEPGQLERVTRDRLGAQANTPAGVAALMLAALLDDPANPVSLRAGLVREFRATLDAANGQPAPSVNRPLTPLDELMQRRQRRA